MLPMTVLRRFDCVLAGTKERVVAEYQRSKGGKLQGDALDTKLNKASGQRFHNHSALDFAKLKGDPDNINKHLVSYIKGFSANVQRTDRHMTQWKRDSTHVVTSLSNRTISSSAFFRSASISARDGDGVNTWKCRLKLIS